MAVGDVYALQLFQLYAGQRCMNTLYFDRKSEPDPNQVAAQALADQWANFLGQMQNAGVSHTGWVLQQVRGGTVSWTTVPCRRIGGFRFEGSYGTAMVGDSAGDGLPPQSAQVVSLLSGFSGRSKRGRIFVTGVSESGQAAGTVAPASVTGNIAIWATQFGIYGSAGTNPDWRMVVWSQTIASGCKPATQHPHALVQGGTPQPSLAATPVASVKVRDIVYSQRRRTIGVGS